MKLTEYIPFKGIDNYYLESKGDLPVNLCFKDKPNNSFRLAIKPKGYIPKSGVFLCKAITPFIKGNSTLDVGTGETGIISIFSSKHGAISVTAVDIDSEIINWAKHNGRLNKIKNVKWLVSDKYSKVKGGFDLIVSNPPQLPMSDGSLHDSGGKDGRSVIDQLIIKAKKYLKPNGSIIILVFDFLSVCKQLGEKITIFDLLKSKGFTPSIIAEVERVVRPEGKTFEALKDIQKYYPKYSFNENPSGDKFYKMQIVKGDLI